MMKYLIVAIDGSGEIAFRRLINTRERAVEIERRLCDSGDYSEVILLGGRSEKTILSVYPEYR